KPVTYNLFEHLGDKWSAYAPIYDLKTKETPEQQRSEIDFARLVSSATDGEFGGRVGDLLDLNEFARFLAAEVLLPSYEGMRPYGFNHPAHEIKRFIDKRAESVRRQLDGKSKGMILKYPEKK